MKYIKELDSVRAIAVILVIISHWLAPFSFVKRIPFGGIGVDIFFVLSGFLITSILLHNRDKAEKFSIAKKKLLINFYVRRALRIFPIYYILLFILFLVADYTETGLKQNFGYFITYTVNIYFFKIQYWDGMLSPLWSLSVEEQFYLLWPWVILFVNKKYLPYTIALFIGIGILSQYIFAYVPMNNVLTHTCFDAFGIGGLLAWVLIHSPNNLQKFYTISSWLMLFAVALFLQGCFADKWKIVPLRIIDSVITIWVIAYIQIKQGTNSFILKNIFGNNILIFLGKISYGLYLYHNFISFFNSKIINRYINPHLPDFIFKKNWGILYLSENIVILFLVAWLSYTTLEKWFLGLKDKFEYVK